MSGTRDAGGILRAVAAPPKLLGAAPDLTKVSGGLALLGFLLTLNGLVFFVVFAALHLVAVLLTWRDPDFARVVIAWALTRRARSFNPMRGNKYVA